MSQQGPFCGGGETGEKLGSAFSTAAGDIVRGLPGPVAQWLEPAAHNGLVAGSSPARPTTVAHSTLQEFRKRKSRSEPPFPPADIQRRWHFHDSKVRDPMSDGSGGVGRIKHRREFGLFYSAAGSPRESEVAERAEAVQRRYQTLQARGSDLVPMGIPPGYVMRNLPRTSPNDAFFLRLFRRRQQRSSTRPRRRTARYINITLQHNAAQGNKAEPLKAAP